MTILLFGALLALVMLVPITGYLYLSYRDTKDDLERMKKKYYRMLAIHSRHRD